MVQHINLTNLANTNTFVSDEMFGVNYLFHRQDLENFQQIAHETNITSVRWPGGSITETSFDINNPDTPPESLDSIGQERFTSLTDFLSACNDLSINPTIVIPSKPCLNSDGSTNQEFVTDVKAFVDSIMDRCGEGKEFENITIEAFEIGNEYWGSGDMTSDQYGKVVNSLSQAIQNELDDYNMGSSEPAILAQMGNPVRNGPDFEPGGAFHNLVQGSTKAQELGLDDTDFLPNGDLRWSAKLELANKLIIDQLSPGARDALDGLVEHHYYIEERDSELDLDFRPETTSFITEKYETWEENGLDLDLHITEWNVHFQNYAQLGQVGAGTLVSQFVDMVRMGVDSASIWPLQHNTANDVAGDFDEDPSYTPLGAAFDLLSENVEGYQLLDSAFESDDIKIASFGKEGSFKSFLISRSDSNQELKIDVCDSPGDVQYVTVTRIYYDSDGVHWMPGEGYVTVEGHLDTDAQSVVTTERVAVGSDGIIDLNLRPFEVVMISYEDASYDEREVIGESEDDALVGTLGADDMWGLDGDDRIWALRGNDKIYGGDGQDKIGGGDGKDTIFGGRGNDTIWGGKEADVISGENGNDEIFGNGGDDLIRGGKGADTVFGASGADTINTGEGDDFVDAGIGNDEIWGFDGNDTIYGGTHHDQVGAGAGDDLMYGGLGNDTLWGDAGNDRIFGEWGEDEIVGGGGNDFLAGNGSNDSLWGGMGDDTLNGGYGNDLLDAGNGNDAIWSGYGDDRVYAGAGDDTIGSGAGEDFISAGSGNDRIFADFGNDSIDSGSGDDLVVAGGNDDYVFGSSGNDSIYGSEGNDTLNGGDDDDFVSGGSGDDLIFFRDGDDTMLGGSGADNFLFDASATGQTVIKDLSLNQGDVLKIARDMLPEDLQDKSILEILEAVSSTNDDGQILISLADGDLTILLEGVEDPADIEGAVAFY